ncbi:DNA-binding winged helix-turn-helix (wHTH) protein [Sulfitobacter undariae]|uniref:DNA-binding winged helix-turn-helix (WHTH) protein n=1 Tax=Sulfitobacter undariae TaxID=1563671 RepID=A0A7W6H211_9RHOB|nr:DNA-binding winged helix-turn-helix (wHTH) protein [Sulfitobacter undariae]
MLDQITSASDIRRSGGRLVVIGISAVASLLVIGAAVLFWALPDANAFNARVERIFMENDNLTSAAEIKLLEILAQSGTAFSDTLTNYRVLIGVLLIFAAAMLVAAVVFLMLLITFNRRMAQIERTGIQVSSLLISREENKVYLNNLGFKLTDAAMETLAVLAEARMDDDILSGSEIEGVISGRSAADCDEAAGATRIKRLRDTLGNQMVSELLVKNIARRGYMLAIDKDVIKVL